MAKSKKFSINFWDFSKGLILAIGTPALYYLQNQLPNFGLSEGMKLAVSVLISYLIKNYFENNKGSLFAKDEDINIGGGGIKNPTKP